MDFTNLNPSEISWVLFGILLAVATFAYPYVRTKVIQSYFPEYSEKELSKKINVIWEKAFLICTFFIFIYFDYFITKAIFVFLYWIGNTSNIPSIITFTKDSFHGLGIVAFLLAIELFVYIFIRLKKQKQGKYLKSISLNDSNKEEFKLIEQLKKQNAQLLEIIQNLSKTAKPKKYNK